MYTQKTWLKILPRKVPQGMWRFANDNRLITQDRGDKLRFNLFNAQGCRLFKFDLASKSHGQSLYCESHENNRYLVYTNAAEGKGFEVYLLDWFLPFQPTLKRVRTIHMKQPFWTFGVDAAHNSIVTPYAEATGKHGLVVYHWKEFVTERKPFYHCNIDPQQADVQCMQGVGVHNNQLFAIFGNSSTSSKKTLMHHDMERGRTRYHTIDCAKKWAIGTYEPEALFVQDTVEFIMDDWFASRVFEVDQAALVK